MNHLQTENLPKIQIDLNSPRFDEFFIESVDQTFSKLGMKVKTTFFAFLETKYNLKRENLPNRIGDFVEGLESVFGEGALPLELCIMKALRKSVPSFSYFADNSDLCFEDYVASLKNYTERLE
jgi:hypothetical protein